MSKHCLAVAGLIALALALSPASAQATLVTHDGTDVLVSDDFEGQTVGNSPAGWSILSAAEGGTITVVDDASPGPAQGSKYVRLAGAPSNDADGGYIAMRAQFPILSSGNIHAEWMMYIQGPDSGDAHVGNFGFHQPNGGARVWASWDRGTTPDGFVSYYRGGADYEDAGVPIAYNRWQKWQLDYTFASTGLSDDTYTISVDGTTSGTLQTWRKADGIFGFVISENGTKAPYSIYVDAVPVPEPTTAVLVLVGAVGVLVYTRCRRR